MAGVSQENGNGSLNVELNIVPFIDLLSTLVLFLLVTAVWLQIGAIPASVDSQGKANNSFTPTNKLEVHVFLGGYRLIWPDGKNGPLQAIPRVQGGYDSDKLLGVITNGLKSKLFTTVAVSSDDNVEYGVVAQTIDAVKSGGVPLVALSTY